MSDNNKKKILYDFDHLREKAKVGGPIGVVWFIDHDTQEVLAKRMNKVLIAGSQTLAEKMFLVNEIVHLPTYNETLSLDNSVTHSSTLNANQKVCLFCCGTEGCGTESSQVYPVKYTKRVMPIPFRYPLKATDLSTELRAKYFGRKTLTDRYAYYFKGFESTPVVYMRFVDGTIIDSGLYDSQNETDAETFAEMTMQITRDDFRDYFRATTGISDARVNSLSLVTGYFTNVTESGQTYKYYQDITPFTQLNFPNEVLIDTTKSIDITYHVYF